MISYSRTLLTMFMVTISLLAFVPNMALSLDRIHVGCPQTMNPIVIGDSVRVPIYVTNDAILGQFHLGFSWNSSQIRITSIDLTGSALSGMQMAGLQPTFFGPDTSYVFIDWIDLSGARPFGRHTSEALLLALNAVVQPGAAEGCITIDTATAVPGLNFGSDRLGGGTPPEYIHCPGADIILGPQDCGYALCGDANGDHAVDISDAVYLLQYIFAGGTAPDPVSIANVNCDANIDIADAVYLILYIFSGSNAPCAGCK